MCLFLGISLQILMLGYLVAGWLLKPCDNFAEYFSDFSRVFLGVCQLYFSASAGGLLGCSSRWQEEAEGGGRRHKDNLAGKLRPAAQH